MFKLTLPPLSWPGYDDDSRDEDGFTLIEILVVIIIIGILAAVAIPIFLNQQRTARDSATTQDVRNAATAIETGMVYDPTATEYKAYTEDAAGEQGAEIAPVVGADGVATVVVPEAEEAFYLQVGDKATPAKVTKSEGTVLEIKADDVDGVNGVDPGAFRIDGWNEKGKEHKNDSTLVYRNALGGLQSESGTGSGSTTPGSENENPGGGDENETETPALRVEGLTTEDGDWWKDYKSSRSWVRSSPSAVSVASGDRVGLGDTVTMQAFAYLPASASPTGEALAIPDGSVATWWLLDDMHRAYKADEGTATFVDGVATFDVQFPGDTGMNRDSLLVDIDWSVKLPDGSTINVMPSRSGQGLPNPSGWGVNEFNAPTYQTSDHWVVR